MTPRVWLAEPDEADAVARLLVEFRNHYGSDWPSDNAFLATVERLMDDRATEFLLGAPHDDAPPSAVCQLRYRLSVWTASDDCWLEDLWVGEDARRSGVGRGLVDAACDLARRRGCRRIELDAAEDNAAAMALYRAAGFVSKNAPGRELFLQRTLG